MNPDTQEKVLKLLKLNSALVPALYSHIQKQAEAQSAEKAAVSPVVKQATDLLIQNNLITEGLRTFTEKKLASHTGAIETLINVITSSRQKAASNVEPVGEPAPGKSNGKANSNSDAVWDRMIGNLRRGR
jgi:hypothetical protein